MVVDATHVYWSQSTGPSDGLIRRVPKGGGAVSNLAAGLNFPDSLNLDDTFVYFASADISRVRKDASVALIDLSWAGMEVTQVLQSIPTTPLVPLIRGKATVVRVFPRGTQDKLAVPAELRGTRGGVALPGSPLRARRELVQIAAGCGLDVRAEFLGDLAVQLRRLGPPAILHLGLRSPTFNFRA